MQKIIIITDSDCSLSPEMSAEYNIRQVPINIHFGDDTYESGVDINDKTLFERVDKEGKLPTTAAPAPGKFKEAFQQAFDDGCEEIICFCVSSKISATIAAAQQAKEMLDSDAITIIDTETVSLGQGFIVLEAAALAKSGKSSKEIIAAAKNVQDNMHLFAALSTLKYLAMGGRISHLQAGMAGIMEVKPILTIQDGKLEVLERIRTRKKSLSRLLELVESSVGDAPIKRLGIIHSNCPEEADAFHKTISTHFSIEGEVPIVEFTAGLSVHSGAGLLGLAVYTA
ncbi:MAG: DegV family protein [Anaerolineaceae bacterium]|nr:DegV family protein [Anaerolineaceae bacterium]